MCCVVHCVPFTQPPPLVPVHPPRSSLPQPPSLIHSHTSAASSVSSSSSTAQSQASIIVHPGESTCNIRSDKNTALYSTEGCICLATKSKKPRYTCKTAVATGRTAGRIVFIYTWTIVACGPLLQAILRILCIIIIILYITNAAVTIASS